MKILKLFIGMQIIYMDRQEEINDFDLSISENSPIGYILEVDLEYCKELHNSHSDYPLSSEKMEVNYDILSKYCK